MAGSQLYHLQVRKAELDAESSQLLNEVSVLEAENKSLETELIYLSDPQRLILEAKAQFNYAEPGEKLIVVVPKKH